MPAPRMPTARMLTRAQILRVEAREPIDLAPWLPARPTPPIGMMYAEVAFISAHKARPLDINADMLIEHLVTSYEGQARARGCRRRQWCTRRAQRGACPVLLHGMAHACVRSLRCTGRACCTRGTTSSAPRTHPLLPATARCPHTHVHACAQVMTCTQQVAFELGGSNLCLTVASITVDVGGASKEVQRGVLAPNTAFLFTNSGSNAVKIVGQKGYANTQLFKTKQVRGPPAVELMIKAGISIRGWESSKGQGCGRGVR